MSDTRVTQSRPTWVVPLLALAVAVALVTYVLTRGGADQGSEQAGGQAAQGAVTPGAPTAVTEPEQPDLRDLERRDDADLLATGPVDAPVVLIVFSDYQCPFCASWSQETLPEMMDYVDAGQLRIEWRDVNVFGEASERAARASYAAGEQGAFWEYHDELFAGGEPRPADQLDDEGLLAIAEGLGLDGEQFRADMASDRTRQQVAVNQKLGLDIGAFSTPTFILGGEPIVGAQPTSVFVEAMDEALAQAGR